MLKDREALAAINPFSKTMLLSTLYWPDEIRALGELELPEEDADFKPAEKPMAKQLVAAMSGEFDPAAFQDEYREALVAVIEAKMDGQEVVRYEAPTEAPKLVDLMAVLEASVAAAKQGRAEAPAAKAADTGPAAKPARATKAKASTAKAPAAKVSTAKAKAAKADEDEAEETPVAQARKRKSA